MSIYKHIEQGVTTDHFVLSHWNNAPTIHMSVYQNPFLHTLSFAMSFIGISIWVGLLISVFQARFFPHKFTSIKCNVINTTARIMSIFIAVHSTIVIAWEWAVGVYCLTFILSCLYRKRKATLIEYGCFIIAGILKTIAAIILLFLFLFPAELLFNSNKPMESYPNVLSVSCILLIISPILISMLFQWNNKAYQTAIPLKSVIFTFIGAFITLMVLQIPEIMWRK
ncbi:MAG: hypothetical protein COB36_07315 [Alphaproteobacteria bacterium]|nr:MAG: hypothetical protein COB36_07315 [Alphaproteobacteria bacterium]